MRKRNRNHKKWIQIGIILCLLGVAIGISGCVDASELNKRSAPTEQFADVIADTKNIAEIYSDIYQNAFQEKTLGSLEIINKIMIQLGKYGYTAVDMNNEIDMVHPEKVAGFCEKVEKKQNADLTILMVLCNGGFARFDFQSKEGLVSIKEYILSWTGTEQHVELTDDYEAYTWKYTDYGYLIFEKYHPPGYDGASGHTAIRVKPLDEICREYNRKYIQPIGYGHNNMFVTEWNENDFGDLNFYDLYEMWYQEKYRRPVTTDSNMKGDIYEISQKEFEDVIALHIRVDSENLQSKTTFFQDKNTYRYRPRGLYDCYFPTYPELEVIEYSNNEDGTITLTVNAVCEWENNDTAFRHEVVVRPTDKGVQYVSNHILESPDYVEPTWYAQRLSDEEWKKCYDGEQ